MYLNIGQLHMILALSRTSECRAHLSVMFATPTILKSLISAVCYCLCATHCEKECDTRECPRCYDDPVDSHTSFTVVGSHTNPSLSVPKLELLAPIFGFLLSMFFTICESLLNTSILGMIYEDMLRSVLIGCDAKKVTIFPAHSTACFIMHPEILLKTKR